MGLGKLGENNTIFIRKFRWLFEIESETPYPFFVKVTQRPVVEIEENFLNETSWIPGKQKWSPVTLTVYDADEKITESILPLFEPTQDITTVLTLLDGCGTPLEKWRLGKSRISKINLGYPGDLQYEFDIYYESIKYESCTQQDLSNDK